MIYDYWKGNKNILTAGKDPDIVLIKGFNDKVFFELGSKGLLRGRALKDYEKLKGEHHELRYQNQNNFSDPSQDSQT